MNIANQALNTLGQNLYGQQNALNVRYESLEAVRGVVEVGRFDRVVEMTIKNVAWMTDCSVTMEYDRRFFRKVIRFKLAEYRAGQAKEAGNRLAGLGIVRDPEIGPR